MAPKAIKQKTSGSPAAKAMQKISHGGQVWCSVPDAARYLGTNATKIREMMGAGKLAFTQQRIGKPIIVRVSDLFELKNRTPDE